MSFLRKMMGMVEGALLGNRMGGTTYGGRNVRPASEDPYGDPADQMGGGTGRGRFGSLGSRFGLNRGGMGNVRPASEDPYGDPADQMGGSRRGPGKMNSMGGGRFGNVRPASEDPYGDPADQIRWRR